MITLRSETYLFSTILALEVLIIFGNVGFDDDDAHVIKNINNINLLFYFLNARVSS